MNMLVIIAVLISSTWIGMALILWKTNLLNVKE
ncbi:hypothetical protein SAMN05216352_104257 [Alteribacillus bidgolensis]|uniref:Uncharacterized protein n=1 Tax=Alteribacillus bidgolensis TaxID=930129 RepID=A0A1G8HHQ9_9BACI|nr:hypothetical protein SAMN05216352_104257 [Alteribacillus bidgolensis]